MKASKERFCRKKIHREELVFMHNEPWLVCHTVSVTIPYSSRMKIITNFYRITSFRYYDSLRITFDITWQSF